MKQRIALYIYIDISSNRWNLGYSNPHPQASQRFNAYETDIFTLTDDDVGKPESIFLWIPQKNKKW